MWTIGIDPGNSGGLALVRGRDGMAMDYVRMPGISGVDDFFRRALILSERDLQCVFEEHHGGGENTSAAAHESRGRYKAIIETLCHVHGVVLVLVTPQVWKKEFSLIQRNEPQPKRPKGISKEEKKKLTADWKATQPTVDEKRKLAKAASCKLAKELFPTINLVFPRCTNEHDGVAEALLIAEWGRRAGL